MAIVTLPNIGGGVDPATINVSVLNGKVDPLATDYNGNIDNNNIASAAGIVYSKLTLTGGIVNADISTSAGIVASKLDLSSIAQNLVMTSKILKQAKGADVASTAGTITLGDDGNYFDITGTAAITSITAKAAGVIVILQFDSTASLVDGSNLKLNGDFQGAAESQICLASDGTNWFEVSRSPSSLSIATQAQQETATSVITTVSPGRQQYHPSASKAWCMFDGTTTGTNAPTAGYNVTSVTRNSAGNYTVTFTTAFSGSSYAVTGSGKRSADDGVLSVTISSRSTGSCVIKTYNSVDAATDGKDMNIVCFGDL